MSLDLGPQHNINVDVVIAGEKEPGGERVVLIRTTITDFDGKPIELLASIEMAVLWRNTMSAVITSARSVHDELRAKAIADQNAKERGKAIGAAVATVDFSNIQDPNEWKLPDASS